MKLYVYITPAIRIRQIKLRRFRFYLVLLFLDLHCPGPWISGDIPTDPRSRISFYMYVFIAPHQNVSRVVHGLAVIRAARGRGQPWHVPQVERSVPRRTT